MITEEKDFYLKHVKSNPRQITKTVYDRGSFRGRETKVTEHDHELHHPDTGEPIFSLTKKSWGKGYHMDWHPYMKDTHPDLERSFEHGSRHPQHGDIRDVDSIDTAKYKGTNRYSEAARGGFKDSLDVKTVSKPTDANPHAFENHFHDPETGQKIGQADNVTNKLTASTNYMNTHGIDHSVLGSLKGNSPYQRAQNLMGEKGKSYSAIGQTMHSGRTMIGHQSYSNTDAPHVRTYKAGMGKSDEEVSAAHEAHIRSKSGAAEGFSVERHSPTVFTATHSGSQHSHGSQHVTSVASKGQLISHQFNPAGTTPEKQEHKF